MTNYFKFLIASIMVSTTLYLYIDALNDLTKLRLEIPLLEKSLKSLLEENKRLQYEIDGFESPLHLMELARKPEFSHLKYPYREDVVYFTEEGRAD